jgi:hypothetical protein
MARKFRTLSAGMTMIALVVAGCGDDDGGSSAENLSKGSATTSSSGKSTETSSASGGTTECKTENAANTTATEEVVVTLGEWTVKPSKQPKAGYVNFKAENGGAEKHELVVVKGDNAEGLPKDADGGLDEDKLPDGGLIGEIEEFSPTQVCSAVFNMPAGKYVLLCNITETEPSGAKESHFKEGMHSSLVVS